MRNWIVNKVNILVIGVAIVGLLSIVVLHKLALENKTSSINSPQSIKIFANYADEIAPHYAWYSEASLKRSLATGRVVLYFYAPWCSTCSVLDDELRKKSVNLPLDVAILKINYDSESELKKKYGVVTQHTLILIDNNGNVLKKWVGGGIEELENHLL